MGGRSREELERIVRPRLEPERLSVAVHPPLYPCADQEELLAAFLSSKPPLSARALEPSVAAAVVSWGVLPFPIKTLVGKLVTHWMGCNANPAHAYIVLDACTCNGCDRHNYGLYVMCMRALPLLRDAMAN